MILVSPSRTITIAGKDYLLDGSFSTLRAVQEFFSKDIVQILINVMDMRLDEISSLVAIGCKQDADDIGQAILDSTGAMTTDYAILKTQLVAWLNVALTPKDAREKKSGDMEALISKSLSRGQITSGSPSAPSDGNPPSSGAATSGN